VKIKGYLILTLSPTSPHLHSTFKVDDYEWKASIRKAEKHEGRNTTFNNEAYHYLWFDIYRIHKKRFYQKITI